MPLDFQPGTYLAEITGHMLSTAKSTGNEQLAIELSVLGEVNPKDPGGELLEIGHLYGRKRTVFKTITDNTVARLIQELQALGYTGQGFTPLDQQQAAENGVEFFSLAGKNVKVTCQHRTYQGNTNERWELAIDGIGGLQSQPVDAAKARGLDARFGHLFKGGAAPAAPAAPQKPAPSSTNNTGTKSEIPF